MTWHLGVATGACIDLPITEMLGHLAAADVHAVELGTAPRHFPTNDAAQVRAVRDGLVTRRMRAIALNPGVSCEQVQANTGFPLVFASDLRETEPPSADELAMLRHLDPDRTYTG